MSSLKTILSGLDKSHLVTYQGFLIHQAIIADFSNMQAAAMRDGIEIAIVSAYRDFDRQQLIWNNKFNGVRPIYDDYDQCVDCTSLDEFEKCLAILRFSMLPGASRHHLGTDLDVFDKQAVASDYKVQLSQAEYSEHGPFAQLANWLKQHAKEFGFYLPYENDLGGVAKEPWHISHIATASRLLDSFSQELLSELITQSEVAGKETLLTHLTEIYQRFVINTANPFADNG